MNLFREVFLGAGQLPADLPASLTAEGIVLLEEGLHGSVTYRNYRRPGFRAALDKKGTTGAIAITRQRFAVWVLRHKEIDIPAGHPLRDAVTVTTSQPGQVCFSYDAGRFSADRSGTVEIRLRTPQAEQVTALLNGAS